MKKNSIVSSNKKESNIFVKIVNISQRKINKLFLKHNRVIHIIEGTVLFKQKNLKEMILKAGDSVIIRKNSNYSYENISKNSKIIYVDIKIN